MNIDTPAKILANKILSSCNGLFVAYSGEAFLCDTERDTKRVLAVKFITSEQNTE